MTVCEHFSQRATCPPSAAVRQLSMADITFIWPRLTWPARNPVIGVWTTTERPRVRMADGSSSGGWVQVSRLGQPLVNEVVVPAGLKDAFNSLTPGQGRHASRPSSSG